MASPRSTAASSQKFIVVPFVSKKGALTMGEMRQASSSVSAERLASAMASRFAGVAAYDVTVDKETGDLRDPKLIASHGTVANLIPDE